jgi:hypothetical protein
MEKNSALERLTRFDLIRASKLLEITQDAIITFVIAFYLGSLIDRAFNNIKPVNANMSNAELVGIILAQFASIVIIAYYIMKVVAVVPFMFSLSSQYVPNMKNEAATGAGMAMAVIFVGVQTHFSAKLAILKSRFALN